MRGAGAGGGMPPRGGERGQDRVEVVGEARRDGGRGAAAGGASGGRVRGEETPREGGFTGGVYTTRAGDRCRPASADPPRRSCRRTLSGPRAKI